MILATRETQMKSDDFLSKAASTICVGGKETLRNPPNFVCADQTHEPFRLMEMPAQFGDKEEQFLWGVVKTWGWQFDGDRTDVHDVFSLVWAAVLRAFGLSSPWLVDEPHVVVPEEIGARHLVLQQCPWDLSENNSFDAARRSMNAWSAFGFHLLDDVFDWERGSSFARPGITTSHQTDKPIWADQLIKFLRYPKDITISRRMFPLWIYFASHKRGVSIIRMPKIRVKSLRVVLTPFVPVMARGEEALAIFANGIPNAVQYKLISKARKLLSLTDDRCDDPLIILPLDSHCLFIGDKTVIALRANCGREIFQREREFLIKRRSSEDRVFFADSVVEWRTPLCAADFEELSVDLIRREPGVIRAKPVGNINDRDGGRDILIDWSIPKPHKKINSESNSNDRTSIKEGKKTIIRVLAQVKSRSKTLGKKDVRDIRDTLDYYNAQAFLLIAHPRISTALIDYLEDLRTKTGFGAEWWEARDIENRLRRHPDLANRYPKLVNLRPRNSI